VAATSHNNDPSIVVHVAFLRFWGINAFEEDREMQKYIWGEKVYTLTFIA